MQLVDAVPYRLYNHFHGAEIPDTINCRIVLDGERFDRYVFVEVFARDVWSDDLQNSHNAFLTIFGLVVIWPFDLKI